MDATQLELKALSFSRSEPVAIKTWLATLPMANLGSVTRSLYEAIGEINRLKASPQQRFEILESLGESVFFAYNGLKKHYLNQPLVLPEQAKRVVNLSKALINRYLEGYKIVIHQCQEKYQGFSLSKPNQLTSAAICRAMSLVQLNIVRSYQLYEDSDKSCWANLHQLFQVASCLKLLDTDCAQLLGSHKSTTSADTYIQLNLLGCVKANQLRQDDIEVIAQQVNKWSPLVKLIPVPEDDFDNLYLVNPHSNTPPIYKKFCQSDCGADSRLLETQALTQHLQALPDEKLSANLRQHLLLAWGVFSERTFLRLESNDNIAICLGMSAAHFFISGGMSFEQLIHGQGEDEPSQPNNSGSDVWATAYDSETTHLAHVELESIDYHIRAEEIAEAQTQKDRERYHSFNARMVNVSPGGYCLQWGNTEVSHLKTGELIGIREKHHSQWSIGVLRWVKHDDNEDIRLGVQLLSPSAIPYGAKVINNRAERSSDFMRVIMLPEIPAIGQPRTLITPAISFKTGQRVELIQNGTVSSLVLQDQIGNSGSYYQFEFELTKKFGQEAQQNLQATASERDDNFDTLWNDL